MTSIPALVASVATRESAVRRCPCGNSACSGEPNRASEPVFGRCASAVSARQLLNVSRGPMAALPLTRSSPATQSTRSSKTFHRPARMPPGARTLAISGPGDVHVEPVHGVAGQHGIDGRVRQRYRLGATRQGADSRQRAAQLGQHRRVRLDRDDVGAQRDQRGGELAGSGAEVEHPQAGRGSSAQRTAACA